MVCLISHCVLQNLFLLTSSAENSPELVQTFHKKPLQSSLKSDLFPAEYPSLHFVIILQRGSFILQCSLGLISIWKANILLTHSPSTLLADSATESLQVDVMIQREVSTLHIQKLNAFAFTGFCPIALLYHTFPYTSFRLCFSSHQLGINRKKTVALLHTCGHTQLPMYILGFGLWFLTFCLYVAVLLILFFSQWICLLLVSF